MFPDFRLDLDFLQKLGDLTGKNKALRIDPILRVWNLAAGYSSQAKIRGHQGKVSFWRELLDSDGVCKYAFLQSSEGYVWHCCPGAGSLLKRPGPWDFVDSAEDPALASRHLRLKIFFFFCKLPSCQDIWAFKNTRLHQKPLLAPRPRWNVSFNPSPFAEWPSVERLQHHRLLAMSLTIWDSGICRFCWLGESE